MSHSQLRTTAVAVVTWASILADAETPGLDDVVAYEKAEKAFEEARRTWRDDFRKGLYERLVKKIEAVRCGARAHDNESNFKAARDLLCEWDPYARYAGFGGITDVLRFAHEGWTISPTLLSREIEFLTEIERLYGV